MFCSKCGTENQDNATMCSNCGESLEQIASGGPPPELKVPTRLVPAILVTLFCCLPFGIVAIVYAAKVNGKVQAGDIEGARASSRKAAIWCWVSFGVGIIFSIISILAAIAIPNFMAYRDRAYNSAAMVDLKNAVTVQEAYFADHQTYTESLEKLKQDYGFLPSEGVTLEIRSAGKEGYEMAAFHVEGKFIYFISGPGGDIQKMPR
jgi:competence protein ComGC